MNHALAIAGRDLRGFLTTPMSYGLMTAYSVISGFFFFVGLQAFFFQEQMAQAQHAQQYLQGLNLNEGVIAPWLATLGIIYLFLLPLLTMRSFAEERGNGTIELLLTSPITAGELVAGKYLAVLGMLGILTLINSVYPAMLFLYGDPEVWQTISGVLALFIYSAALGALGCFISSLTRSQILAAVVGILVSLIILVLNEASRFLATGWFSDVLLYLGTQPHFENGILGKVYSEDLVYFAIFSMLFLFLARSSVESLRWR